MSRTQGAHNPPASTGNPPLDSLTSLRFFAALAVVFYHSGSGFVANSGSAPKFIQNLLDNGWLGVPFFFILSGFILTYAHADLHFDRLELKRFFVARFARLYPVYLLALMLSVPFVEHYNISADWYQFFLLQKWFPKSGATDWNFVAWTLSVELFFYCLFPFAFGFMRRLSNRTLLLGLGVTIAFLILIWGNMTPRLGDGELRIAGLILYLPVPLLRVPEFIYGMLLSVLYLRRTFGASNAIVYVSALLVVFASAFSTSTVAQALVILALGLLILSLATSSFDNMFRKILENKKLVTLGGASYALYLLQYPIRRSMSVFVPDQYQIFARLAYAPALIVISLLVFKYYEGPMRKTLRRAFELAAVE